MKKMKVCPDETNLLYGIDEGFFCLVLLFAGVSLALTSSVSLFILLTIAILFPNLFRLAFHSSNHCYSVSFFATAVLSPVTCVAFSLPRPWLSGFTLHTCTIHVWLEKFTPCVCVGYCMGIVGEWFLSRGLVV